MKDCRFLGGGLLTAAILFGGGCSTIDRHLVIDQTIDDRDFAEILATATRSIEPSAGGEVDERLDTLKELCEKRKESKFSHHNLMTGLKATAFWIGLAATATGATVLAVNGAASQGAKDDASTSVVAVGAAVSGIGALVQVTSPVFETQADSAMNEIMKIQTAIRAAASASETELPIKLDELERICKSR